MNTRYWKGRGALGVALFAMILVAALACLAVPGLAADAPPGPAAVSESTIEPPPADPSGLALSWQQALIPLLVPLLVAGFKKIMPTISSRWLPGVAILAGFLCDMLLHLAGLVHGPPWVGALLGAAGVGFREVQDQAKKAISG